MHSLRRRVFATIALLLILFSGINSAPLPASGVGVVGVNAHSAEMLRDFTRMHFDDASVVFFDGTVLTTPRVVEPVPDSKSGVNGPHQLAEDRGLAGYTSAGTASVHLKMVVKDTILPRLE